MRGFHFCAQMLYAFKVDHKHYFALGKMRLPSDCRHFTHSGCSLFLESTEYHPRGDLLTYMRAYAMEYNTVRLCAAEILLAIEYLHSKKIIYRDLKPENVLIDNLGHMVLADFGLSEQLIEKESADGCSGTTEYMAPGKDSKNFFLIIWLIFFCSLNLLGACDAEAIRVSDVGFGRTVDFWSWGCVLYQMLTDRLPFEVDDELRHDIHADEFLKWNILYAEPCYDYQTFRSHRIAQRFLEQLLEKTSNKRLGKCEWCQWACDLDSTFVNCFGFSLQVPVPMASRTSKRTHFLSKCLWSIDFCFVMITSSCDYPLNKRYRLAIRLLQAV